MAKLTQSVVSEFVRVVTDCQKNNELIGEKNIVCQKELKGKKIMVFNVSRFVNVSGKFNVPPSKVAETIEIILEGLKKAKEKWEKIGSPEVCYFRKTISWKIKGEYSGEYFDRFVKCWNESGGSANKTSESFGTNEWGEILLTPPNVKQRAKDIAKNMGDKNPLCAATDEKIADLTPEAVASIIADLDI